MFKIFPFYLAILAIFLLLLATTILAYYNFNSKIQNLLFTGLFVGTATAFVTIFVGLKAVTIERSFVTSVIMNEQQHLPIFVHSTKTPLEERLSRLMFLGNPQRKNGDGIIESTIKTPSNFEETLSYCGELIQYSILRTIREIHEESNGAAMEMEESRTFVKPTIHRPIYPPLKAKYTEEEMKGILSRNRFSNSSTEDFRWENGPLILPKNTTVNLVHIDSTPETGSEAFLVKIEKRNYFKIDISIRPSVQPSQGAIPRGLIVSDEIARNSRVYFFIVEMKAVLPALTAENPERENYIKWIEWVFSGIQDRVSA